MKEKILKFEEKIWKIIDKYKFNIFFVVITVVAFYARYKMMGLKTEDYYDYLEPWFNTLKENGGLSALSKQVGNYNEPYMFILALLTYIPAEPLMLIKSVSILFDFICAGAIMKIVEIIFDNNKRKLLYSTIAYSVVLFLPAVLLNSSAWGQADSIYCAFALLAIAYLLEKKYLKAFVFLGISFAFKLQALFILPVFIFIYISERKFPLYYFATIPVVNVIMCIPSMIAGKPIKECLSVYFEQASEYGQWMSMNISNVYNLLFKVNDQNLTITPNEYIDKAGIMVTLGIFILMAFLVLYKRVKFEKKAIIEFSLWSVLTAVFFLPHMHERYIFIAEILCLIYYIYNKDKWYIPVGITIISIYHYGVYLFGQNVIPIQYVSILYLVILVILTKDILNKYIMIEKSCN